MLALIVTVPILIYQLVIGSAIVLAGRVGGRGWLIVTVVLACLWTLSHVIFPPLMVLQFVTIGVATAVGLSLAKKRDLPSTAPESSTSDAS